MKDLLVEELKRLKQLLKLHALLTELKNSRSHYAILFFILFVSFLLYSIVEFPSVPLGRAISNILVLPVSGLKSMSGLLLGTMIGILIILAYRMVIAVKKYS